MADNLESTGSPLARMADEHFHKTLESEEGEQSMREFAGRFSLNEWRAASHHMGKGTVVSDLSVSEKANTLEIHGSPEALHKQVLASTETYDNRALIAIPGAALVVGGLLLKDSSAGRLCRIFGAFWTVTGLTNYYSNKPEALKSINSLSNVIIPKNELRPDQAGH